MYTCTVAEDVPENERTDEKAKRKNKSSRISWVREEKKIVFRNQREGLCNKKKRKTNCRRHRKLKIAHTDLKKNETLWEISLSLCGRETTTQTHWMCIWKSPNRTNFFSLLLLLHTHLTSLGIVNGFRLFILPIFFFSSSFFLIWFF